MGLEEYKEKRDFKRTPEPAPQKEAGKGPLTFVVQKHHARQLHYDFRLELDGVLKSWAAPKGPSLNPEDKHLAAMVEDHPLEYAAFEGNIPKGEYGAGEVIVWDHGDYSPDENGVLLFDNREAAEEQMRSGLKKGKLSFFLRGQKLKGSWTLVKMQKTEKDWLLIKHRDDYAATGVDILKEDKSAVSGLTIEDVKEGRFASKEVSRHVNPKVVPGARPASFPSAVAPMLASLGGLPLADPVWIYEPKLDGYRIMAYLRDGKATLFSRRGNNVTRQYGVLVSDLEQQPVSEIILDGELIAMDEKGKQCFQCLQHFLNPDGGTGKQAGNFPLIYYVFDMIYLDGYDLRDVKLRYRKELLGKILRPTGRVRLVDYFEGHGKTVFEAAVKNGLEGVVAKQIDSLYEPGKRSGKWLKVKAKLSDEFVVGGYSLKKGGREKTLSSLLLGYFDPEGKLVYAGNVGSGFDEDILIELRKKLDAISINHSPFSEVPKLNAPSTWVRPEMVVEVKFSEWTQDGRLRAPVFLRFREDKAPEETSQGEFLAATVTGQPLEAEEQKTMLEQLRNPNDSFSIEVEGSTISLSNMEKMLWPVADSHPGFSKRDLLVYLARVSPYILPHLKDRPLTMSRYPDGINGEHFYQKHWGHPVPEFVEKVQIREEKGSQSEYLVCNNLATLLWLGQAANLEFHTWFSRIKAKPDIAEEKTGVDSLLDYPDFLIFDLDPYLYSGKEPTGAEPELNREGFARTCEVAFWLKEVLDGLSLRAFVKTSGKTGLHVYVPIIRNLDYKAVRAAAETIGQFLLQRHPREITMEWSTEKRKGKVFLDWGQNVRGKTLASIYSPRPAPEAAVSTPLRWEELGKVYPADFTLATLPGRLKKMGDLWVDILAAKSDLDMLLREQLS